MVQIEVVQDLLTSETQCRSILRRLLINKHMKSKNRSIVQPFTDLIFENGNLFMVTELGQSTLRNILT